MTPPVRAQLRLTARPGIAGGPSNGVPGPGPAISEENGGLKSKRVRLETDR